MAEAKRPGGLYYTAEGKAVDSEGREIKDAPKRPKDTSPEEMARVAQSTDPVQRLAETLDRTFGGGAHAASMAAMRGPATPAASSAVAADDDEGGTDSEEEEGLPPLAEMEAHLNTISDVDELKSMRRSDKRKGAKPLYAARIKELEGGE
jgi:hypothetical protein